jgi:hypothetical protein
MDQAQGIIDHLRALLKALEAERDTLKVGVARACAQRIALALNKTLEADAESAKQFVSNGLLHAMNEACGGHLRMERNERGEVVRFAVLEE